LLYATSAPSLMDASRGQETENGVYCASTVFNVVVPSDWALSRGWRGVGYPHTTPKGVLSKLFSVNAVWSGSIPPTSCRSRLRATVANKLEEILMGWLPTSPSLWISYSLYRFESNVRSAAPFGPAWWALAYWRHPSWLGYSMRGFLINFQPPRYAVSIVIIICVVIHSDFDFTAVASKAYFYVCFFLPKNLSRHTAIQ